MPKRKPRADTTLRVCWASTGPTVEAGDFSEERIKLLRRLLEGR